MSLLTLLGVGGASGGGGGPDALSAAILAASPLAYWRMDEPSGTTFADASGNGRNGAVGGAGVTLGQSISPYTAPLFATGITGHADLFSAGLAGVFDGDEGAAVIVCRPDNVTTGTRQILYLAGALGTSIRITQSGTAVLIRRDDSVGTVQQNRTSSFAAGTSVFIAMRWSVAGDVLSGIIGSNAIGAGGSGLATWDDTLSGVFVSGQATTGTTARFAGHACQVAVFDNPNVDLAALAAASGL